MRAFVIAMADEADAVRPTLKGDDVLVVCGVGKVNAAAATQHMIDQGCDEVWTIGLSGGFGPDVKVGESYEVSSAVEYDFDLAKVNGTAIGVLDEKTSPYLPMKPIGKRPAKILMTGDRFNDSDEDDNLIQNVLKGELRDMEGAAVAHICDKYGVTCHGLKCVSDVHGADSMTDQYKQNRAWCLQRLAVAVKEVLG